MTRRAQRSGGAGTLLSPTARSEDECRSHIRSWLVEEGVPAASIRPEYQTAEGPVGLYLTNRRVIIEVKKGGSLPRGPYAVGTGSREGETAFGQLERRLRAERVRERLHLENGVRDKSWIGAITDCRIWYAWEWGPRPGGAGDAAARIDAWHGQTLDSGNIKRLARLLARAPIGKEWATADMSGIFRGVKRDLADAYARRSGLREVRIQKGLWLDQIKAGGNAPESDEDELFVTHTMLVLIARMISNHQSARQGFVGWVPDDIAQKIRGVIDEYNWDQQTGDVLRALYRRYIPARHRLRYGEYYTPDWLAEAMCNVIIDDVFIGEQIRRFQSGREVERVLDPACGSGTFLYHAIRRITESEPVRSSYMGRSDVARLASLMVRGMDIHPVAVEMARANARRLLRTAEDADLMIYQGDSLLAPRPESTVLGAGGDDLPLTSPQGRHLVLPGWFIASEANLSRFVKSAVDGAGMPDGLGREMEGYDGEQLAESHDNLRRIVREEGNGVWLWYISNHAGAMKLRGTIGRIAANPPWVTYDKIQQERRKSEVRRMAEERGLWVGGSSTKFDIAALFVDRCAELYLAEGGRSGWVLPLSAVRGHTWAGLRSAAGGKARSVWDVGNLAFQSHACVMFFGVDAGDKRLVKERGARIRDGDLWAEVSKNTRWDDMPREAEEKESEWLAGKKSLVRRGASMIPQCLVWADSVRARGGEAHVVTRASRWPPWSAIGTVEGAVPAHWIRGCVSSRDLYPFAAPGRTRCIVPVDEGGGGWDARRLGNRFWRRAGDQYRAHRGRGSSTPATLEDRINYNNGIFDQLARRGHAAVYNKSGSSIRACAISGPEIVHDTLHYVACAGSREALFITGMLNAGAMLPAFLAARRNERDFAEHVWRAVPMPRYDGRNALHRRLASLSGRAARTAAKVLAGAGGGDGLAAAKTVREALADSGVSGQIDDVCRELLPDYAARGGARGAAR